MICCDVCLLEGKLPKVAAVPVTIFHGCQTTIDLCPAHEQEFEGARAAFILRLREFTPRDIQLWLNKMNDKAP